MELGIEDNLWRSYLNALVEFKRMKAKKGLKWVIWVTVCWNIWVKRNVVVFRNER